MVQLKLTGETGMVVHASPVYDEYLIRRTNYDTVRVASYEISPVNQIAEKQ